MSVGKTSIIQKYTNNIFSENTMPTLGVDFAKKIINVNQTNIKLSIWDTSGQE